jgi:hypothetical protein
MLRSKNRDDAEPTPVAQEKVPAKFTLIPAVSLLSKRLSLLGKFLD